MLCKQIHGDESNEKSWDNIQNSETWLKELKSKHKLSHTGYVKCIQFAKKNVRFHHKKKEIIIGECFLEPAWNDNKYSIEKTLFSPFSCF